LDRHWRETRMDETKRICAMQLIVHHPTTRGSC
jgi:hypothetical protein